MAQAGDQEREDAQSSGQVNWKRLVPGLLLSLAAVIVILKIIDPQKVIEALQHADLRWIGVSYLLSVIWLVVRAFFWRTLLRGKVSLRDVFLTINEGYLLNYVLPFRLGEIGRALLLSRKSDLQFWQIIPSIIIERALDMGMALVIFIGSISFVIKADSALSVALIMGALVAVGLLALFLAARQPEIITRLAEIMTARIPRLKSFVDHQLGVFLDGLSILADGRLFLIAIFWLLLNWMISILQITTLLRAFYPEVQVLWSFFILGSAALGNAAPSTPGAIGVADLAITGAIMFFNRDANKAGAYAVMSRVISYVNAGVIGIFALSQEKVSLKMLFLNLYRRSQGRE